MSRPPFIGPVLPANPPLPAERACRECKLTLPIDRYARTNNRNDNRRRICKSCVVKEQSAKYYADPTRHREYRRQWSQQPVRIIARVVSESRQKAANPEKFKARIAVNNAIKRGKMARLPCRDCGDPNSHAHHHDYSKPLDVEFLCRQCHAAEHRAERGTPLVGMKKAAGH